MKDKTTFIKFLLNITKQQLVTFLRITTKEQLQTIIEIIYNVVHGVCDSNKLTLSKHKNIIRKLVVKRSSLVERKKLLLKIHNILPVFLQAYIKHVS